MLKSVCAVFLAASSVIDAHPFGLAPYYHTLDLLWVQDFSLSFENDLPLLRQQFPDAIEELKWTFPHSRFGLAGFTDKPLEKFGYEVSKDYCYQLRYKLTRYTSRLRESFDAAKTHSGGDWPESQLQAMLTAARSNETNWSETDETPNGYLIHRLMVIVTDAGYHQAGDSKLPPNDGDGVVDCLGEDYPSVEQVKDALSARSITPLFLVTADVAPIYRRLVRDLGNNGVVWKIENDSRNVRNALTSAISAVLNNDCDGERCDGGCVGENCCNGEHCDAEADAVLIHIDQMPKNLRVIVDEE